MSRGWLLMSFRRAVFLVAAVASGLAFSESTWCQGSDATRPASSAVERNGKTLAELTGWKILLDNLRVETRVLEPEQERPLVVAELADAYWELDQKLARKLFIEAFEAALAVGTQAGREPVAPILSTIAKRDRALARELTKRLLGTHSEEKNSSARSAKSPRSPKSLTVARDLLETDPRFAVELAKLSTSLGPSMSGLWLLFQVAQTDPAGAAEIYDAYLRNLARAPDPDLSLVLWLAGYPFGYGEAYGGSIDPISLTGFGGVRVSDLSAQKERAATYLQLAFVAITNTLKKAAGLNNEEKELLNALALFSAAYLYPEAQRFSPGSEGAWSALYRQALANTTEPRRLAVEQRLHSIKEVRVRAAGSPSGEEHARTEAKEKLEQIEKLPDSCSRDRAYAEVALAYSYAKDFRQARQIADRIEGLALRESVLQFTSYDEASALLESGDLVRASDQVEKVAAKEQRAILYVRIAKAALKKSDESMALDLLNRARLLVRDSDDADFQAGVFLSAGAIYAQFDTSEATYAMKESVKAINRMKERVGATFSVLRRVTLNCTAGEDRWFGGRESLETFSLYETLGTIAKSEIRGEGALSVASEIQDKPTRIRAQLSIVKAVMK